MLSPNALPAHRAPTRADWTRLSRPWREQVAARIRELQELQNTLDGCLGCGCLSLTRCKLYNPGDEARQEGWLTLAPWRSDSQHLLS